MTDRPSMSDQSAADVARLIANYPDTAEDTEALRLLLTLAWLYGHSAGFADYRDGVRAVLATMEREGL